MQKKNIVLSSTEPIMDGGRKYNFLYIIGLIIGFVVGVILEGINMGIFFALIGALVACAVKNFMCEVDCTNLRHMSFACTRKIPYAQLIQGLQPLLLPLNMVIERKKDGNPTILYKGLIYDVSYNEDDTFGIWWRRPVNIKTFLITKIYVSIIRRASVAYGIIAYNVQKICNDSSSENTDVIEQEEIVFQKQDIITCPSCGNECKMGTKFCMKCGSNLEMRDGGKRVASENSHIKKSGKLKYIIHSVLVILIGLVCIIVFISKDGNNEEYISIVRDGYLGEFTDATVQDILNNQLGAFDYNLEWTNANHDGSEYVGMRAYTEDDVLGEINILFEVFPDNGTFKVIDYADDSSTDYQATQIADKLNNYYMYWYIFDQFESGASRDEETAIMQELITRFDNISGTAVLYGASKDYAGDRGRLGVLIDNQEPLSLSVTELINQYSDNMLDVYTDASESDIIEEQDIVSNEIEEIEITKTVEYTSWDEMSETLITLEYVSEEQGFITISYTDETGTSVKQRAFKYDGGMYQILDERGEARDLVFEIRHDVEGDVEYEYMNLIDMSEGDYQTYLEKEYAYNNVG